MSNVKNWASILDDVTRKQADMLSRAPGIAGHVALMPDAHLVVGRELTKLHEQIWRGSPADAVDEFAQPRGEFTILITPPQEEPILWSDAQIADALAEAAEQGASRSQAARFVAQQSGRPRRDIYALWPFSKNQ